MRDPSRRLYAESVFARFRALPGSDEIATAFAIEGLAKLLLWHRPKRIIEVGGGLGTLSQVILDHGAAATSLTVLERNAWCGARWDENLAASVQGRCVFRLSAWPDKPYGWPERPVDLLVVDDWLPLRYDQVEVLLARRALIFAEGNRVIERCIVREGLRAKGRRVAALNQRPWDRSKGFWILRADATRREWFWWGCRTLAGRLLDGLVCPLLGVRPSWRRRDVNPET